MPGLDPEQSAHRILDTHVLTGYLIVGLVTLQLLLTFFFKPKGSHKESQHKEAENTELTFPNIEDGSDTSPSRRMKRQQKQEEKKRTRTK